MQKQKNTGSRPLSFDPVSDKASTDCASSRLVVHPEPDEGRMSGGEGSAESISKSCESQRQTEEKNSEVVSAKKDENILVVKREYLFPVENWQGLKSPKEFGFSPDFAAVQDQSFSQDLGVGKNCDSLKQDYGHNFLHAIMQKREFLPRSLMEQDYSYKQIIPYLVFRHEDKYFLMQRKAKASETRLKSKYSFGIGGHIRQEDIKTDDIAQWAEREFTEEIEYSGRFEVKFLGVLNDDSNDVGRVHVGFVYLLDGDSCQICVKDELESGILLSLSECEPYYEFMEEWSKIVFNFLKNIG